MSQVRNFAELTPNIGFTEFDFYELYRSTFENDRPYEAVDELQVAG